jgi:hypothetical protein
LTQRPAEVVEIHTRIMKCALDIENSRAYWEHAGGTEKVSASEAFGAYWFGARSLARVRMLLAHLKVRFDAYPSALQVLHGWTEMDPDARRLICHWHLQLSDPLYRAFTGEYLVGRVEAGRFDVGRDLVVGWVEEQAPKRWTMATRMKFASKLLSAATSAGLVLPGREPRKIEYPRVGDLPLTYMLYLLREVDFAGTLLENPYLASVGLRNDVLEHRLRGLKALRFVRQGNLAEFGWRHADLLGWASATVLAGPPPSPGATP